jgi:hypothetical protein
MIATNGAVAAKQPPSVRDFQIYQFVKFDCNSTREAAHEFDLSQTRVRQVLARVGQFFIEAVPREEGDDPRQVRLAAAEGLAREQLEYLYRRALMAFDQTHTQDVHGNLLPGKVAYLALAGRIVLWMSKVPLHPPVEFGEHEEELNEDTRERPDPNDPEVVAYRQRVLADIARMQAEGEAKREAARIKIAKEREECRQRVEGQRAERQARLRSPANGDNPPNKECSPGEVSSGDSQARAVDNGAVSIPEEGTYRTLEEIKAQARREFLHPAQARDLAECNTPQSSVVAELATATEELGADEFDDRPNNRPLSRKERRARKRRLAKLMAKR